MPSPSPGPDEVLIDIKATAVNYVDLLVIAGKYQFRPECPFIPGKAPAGVVAATGDRVDRCKVGDRVLAMAEQGGYAEQVTVSAEQCYRLPDCMSYADAAALALVYDTAWVALRERARLKEGEVALILGASGGVGHAAVQLAKVMGARTLAGIARQDRTELVLSAGAEAVIDLGTDNLHDGLRQQVHEVNRGRGADVILDPLGGDIFDAAIRALAWRGRMVVIGFAAGRIPTVKANYLLLKNIEVSGLQVSDYRRRTPDIMQECFAEIFTLYEAGKIKPAPITRFSLEDYQSALVQVRDRAACGRLILTVEEEGV
jgi:NADPH2:quinone reductase